MAPAPENRERFSASGRAPRGANREFPGNFRISPDFSAIKMNFRAPRDAPPCVTSCTLMLHLSHCAALLFRDRRDSASLSAKTVSHCRRFGVVFGQRMTQACAMWRIADGQAPGGPANVRLDNSEGRGGCRQLLPWPCRLAMAMTRRRSGSPGRMPAGRARRGGVKRALTLAG